MGNNITEMGNEEWQALNQENIEVINKAIAAISAADAETLLGMMSPNLQFRMNGTTPFSRTLDNLQDFAQLFGDVASHLDGFIELEVTNFIPAGDWIITETKGTAKMLDGRPYCNSYVQLWKVEEGVITALTEYNDSQLIMDTFNFD